MVAMEGETNEHCDRGTHLEQDICIHIFTVSSAMVGVCLTVIGLIRVVITLGTADTLADDFLAGERAAISDLVSAFLLGAAFAVDAPNASAGKHRRCNLYLRDDRDGDHLCIDHLHHLCSGPTRPWLKQLFENPQPISAQYFFDLVVAESALDQPAAEIARMRMVP